MMSQRSGARGPRAQQQGAALEDTQLCRNWEVTAAATGRDVAIRSCLRKQDPSAAAKD